MSQHTTLYVRDASPPFIVQHDSDIPDSRARLAQAILSHFALISAQDDGEDNAGRQKLRLLSPGEIAKRACDLSAAYYDEIEARGWLIHVPPFEEAEAEAARLNAARRASARSSIGE